MDRGVWWTTAHEVAKSQTRLSNWTCICIIISTVMKNVWLIIFRNQEWDWRGKLSKLSLATVTNRGFPSGSVVKNPPAMQELQETWVQSLGEEEPLEEGMATHSSILAWRIPRSEETGELQSTGLQRVGHDWSHLACTHAHHNKCYRLNGLTDRHWFLTVLKAGKYEDQGVNWFSSCWKWKVKVLLTQ